MTASMATTLIHTSRKIGATRSLDFKALLDATEAGLGVAKLRFSISIFKGRRVSAS